MLPNATLGAILSIRAFKLESSYGSDLLILGLHNDRQTVRVTTCFDFSAGTQVSMVLQMKTYESKRSLGTSFCSAPSIPVRAGGNHKLSAGGDPMLRAGRKRHVSWKSNCDFGSQYFVLKVLTKTPNCRNRTSKIFRHGKDGDEADGACSWAKFKILITAGMPNMQDVSPHIGLRKLTKSTDIE